MLKSSLESSEKQIEFREALATSTNLRNIVTKADQSGCRALHYTGHGMIKKNGQCILAFENDSSRMVIKHT